MTALMNMTCGALNSCLAHTSNTLPESFCRSRYDYTVRDLDTNKEVALSKYRGKVSLIVNVASK